jgi:hypothetical protein
MRSSARRSGQVASKRSKVSEHPLIGPAPWSPGPSVIQGLCWRKWSFPFGSLGPDGAGLPGWTVVHKRRRMSRFRLVGRQLMAEVAERAAGPECGVELTEVRSGGQTWWSLGFEATGPADLLRSTLEGAAAAIHPREGEESPARRRQDQGPSPDQRRERRTEITPGRGTPCLT